MKAHKQPFRLILALAVLTAAGLGFWRYARIASVDANAPRILYYQDSMHPWVKSDRPGKCTICAMDLTPIFEGQQGFQAGDGLLALSPQSVTVMNVQSEAVTRRPLHRELRVAGVLEADSTRKTILAAPAPGRIDNVRVASAGVEVQAGQVLATFYSPDLTFQTRRYIFRDRITDQGSHSNSMPPTMAGSSRHTPNPGRSTRAQPLAATERADADPFYNDLLATQSGTVVDRGVFDGQYVAEGDRLFTIVDCSVLWFRFDVYEQQLTWLEPGQELEVTVPAIPGNVFPASIAIIEPTLDQTTRTVKVRADVENPLEGEPGRQQRFLRLGMYADGRLRAQVADVLAVPRSAVLFPGSDAYTYVDRGGGAYEMRKVALGRQGDEHWEIVSGLDEGERVVIAGNVLIDAQAQFNRGGTPETAPATAAAPEHHDDHGDHGAPAGSTLLVETQLQAVADFLAVADGISDALASDSLEQLERHTRQLPALVPTLAAAFPANHRWHATIERIIASAPPPAAVSLDAARKAFLPFSTNVVELVRHARAADTAFKSLKVFFCPMAPEPGLWFQARNPLRNPYYGAKMLHCGEEVTP